MTRSTRENKWHVYLEIDCVLPNGETVLGTGCQSRGKEQHESERNNMRVKGWAWNSLSCRLGSMAFPPECRILLLRIVNQSYLVTIVEWETQRIFCRNAFVCLHHQILGREVGA